MGVSNMKSQATMVENYLNRGSNVLWFVAESVDQMIKKGIPGKDILDYLTGVSNSMKEKYDVNFTGIYGYLNHEYIDGAGWTPPADYDPKSRSWYKEAVVAKGEMVMSDPYVDAQTNQIIISYSQLLSDGESVISLDIVLTEVQKITEEMTMGNMGYGFIVDDEGLVIAHSDPSQIGKDYSEDSRWRLLLAAISSDDENTRNEYELTVDKEECTAFTDTIADGWHVVIIANNERMYHNLRVQLVTGIIASGVVFLIIVLFCIISLKIISRAEKNEQKSQDRLNEMNMNIIRSLASTIDAKDRYTSGHSQRVAEYAEMIAKRMGKSKEDQKAIYFAGLLHDVGKIRVSESIINKNGKLTDEEFDQIRIHPVSGYHILRGIHEDPRIGFGTKYHHERFDGNGYPNKLEGKNIPEVARILAVADAYDAMASDRSYRKALPQVIVRGEIQRGRGTQFDPEIADIMLEIIDEDTDYNLRQKDDMVRRILIIDDEEIILMHVESILMTAMNNLYISKAQNAEEALEIVKKSPIDLILLDLMMPDIDGFTLAEQIRQIRDIPIIIMTGDKSIDTIRRIREYQIDDYLTKPLIPSIAREAVHGILSGNRTRHINTPDKNPKNSLKEGLMNK